MHMFSLDVDKVATTINMSIYVLRIKLIRARRFITLIEGTEIDFFSETCFDFLLDTCFVACEAYFF